MFEFHRLYKILTKNKTKTLIHTLLHLYLNPPPKQMQNAAVNRHSKGQVKITAAVPTAWFSLSQLKCVMRGWVRTPKRSRSLTVKFKWSFLARNH